MEYRFVVPWLRRDRSPLDRLGASQGNIGGLEFPLIRYESESLVQEVSSKSKIAISSFNFDIGVNYHEN